MMGIGLSNCKQEALLKVSKGVAEDVNDIFMGLTGFSREEVIGKDIDLVLGELFRTAHKIDFTDKETEEALFTKDLDVRIVAAKKYEDLNNEVTTYFFHELENSRLDNKLMFVNKLITDEKVGIGIFTAKDFKLLKANQTYLNYLPRPLTAKHTAYGKCLKDIIPAYENSRGEKIWRSIVENNKTIYVTEKHGLMLSNDDRYWDNTIAPVCENGEVKYLVSMLENVTERVLSREHIRIKNEQLEAIIDNMYDGLTVVNRDGELIKTNKAVNRIMRNKKDADNMLINTWESIKDGQEYYDEYGNKLSLSETPYFRVLKGERIEQQRILVRDGTKETYLDFNAIPIYDVSGELQHGVIISHDITDLIRNEKEIKMQQELLLKAEEEKRQTLEKALTMKDEFISLISHEFKTPLNVIYSALQLIEHVYSRQVSERVQGLLGNIKQNTFRQLRLVNNLLDITRLYSGRFRLDIKKVDVVFLIRLITESVKLYADQKNIGLCFECSMQSKVISVDDEKLERILLNLLSNAIKFTSHGGSITVRLKENKKTNKVVIEVSDTGIGIPEDKQGIIFERFGQVESDLSRHAEGTGIGLSLVKNLVGILGGEIELESELGKGSTFRILLPMNESVEHEHYEQYEASLDVDNRLVNAMNVEFSDIYF